GLRYKCYVTLLNRSGSGCSALITHGLVKMVAKGESGEKMNRKKDRAEKYNKVQWAKIDTDTLSLIEHGCAKKFQVWHRSDCHFIVSEVKCDCSYLPNFAEVWSLQLAFAKKSFTTSPESSSS